MRPMEVSNADRIVYPRDGITKGDVVAYYASVAPAMLEHIAGRPLTLQRFPKGIGEKGFMQKNAPDHFPATIERLEVPSRERTTTYPIVHKAEDIPYLANQGTITFHVWTSRLPHLGRPDRIVFDLDPPEGASDDARHASLLVRTLLDDLGLPSIPVATGSKGFHVVAAIEPRIATERLAEATQGAATWLARRHPDELTDEFRIDNRRSRVFVDWLRNRPGQTGVAPWSLRPRNGAPVAVPITWDELAATEPDAFELEAIGERLATGDPLAQLAATPVDPEPPITALEQLLAADGIEPTTFDRFRS